jgi:hypothetical protein
MTSFLSDPFHSFENQLQLSWLGPMERMIMKYLERGEKEERASKDVQVKRNM